MIAIQKQKMKTECKFHNIKGGNRKMKNLGNIFRIITAIGLVTVLCMAIYAKPATAEDGSSDGIAQVRPPHPCSVTANLGRQLESQRETCDSLHEAWSDAVEDNAENGRRRREMVDRIKALQEIITDEFDDLSGWPDYGGHPINADTAISIFFREMERFLEYYRDCDAWDRDVDHRIEERLRELRALIASLDDFSRVCDSSADMVFTALYRWEECKIDLSSVNGSYVRAQRECNLTRSYFSRSLRDGQTQNLMSLYEGPMSLDSDADQASKEDYSRIPFCVPKKNLPTAQIMQVHQQKSNSPGTNAAGYTHMTPPQNTGRSKPAVRTAGTLKAAARVKRK
jgi:hypothetical protein